MAGADTAMSGRGSKRLRIRRHQNPPPTAQNTPPPRVRNHPFVEQRQIPLNEADYNQHYVWFIKNVLGPIMRYYIAFLSLFLTFQPLPPPVPPAANQERDTLGDTVITRPAGDQGPVLNNNSGEQCIQGQLGMKNSEKQKTSTDHGGVLELELMLKEKTLSRFELELLKKVIDERLTAESSRDGEKGAGNPTASHKVRLANKAEKDKEKAGGKN